MNEFEVNILAADRPFYQGPCVHLQVPISTGQYGILAHHRNVIAAIVPGKLRLRTPDGAEQTAAVSRGFLKVENNHVLLLADTIERPEEIDAVRAQREVDQAREIILQKKSRQEYRIAQATLARALNRLRVKARDVD